MVPLGLVLVGAASVKAPWGEVLGDGADEGDASQGRQLKASPAIKRHPLPPVILTPLSRWKPSLRQASMAVVGGGVLARTFMALKSVWVSSFEVGPRSVVRGGFDGGRLERGKDMAKE